MVKNLTIIIVMLGILLNKSNAQQLPWNSGQMQLQLEKLNVLGSVLYFAAHPDDENTKLIAWLSQEKKYRTSYLSLTRGEGGQNLIGTDLGVNLGLIRTHELLAARQIDKGEQYFSSAYDFGFSKTHEETFRFWDKETVLSEAVFMIRKLQPDIIITRFPPDKRGGHGHHQASAILAHDAFIAAGDPKRFPEQLQYVQIWQAKRLLWNTANFGGQNNTSDEQLKIDIGDFNNLLGQSYGEISSKSRSQHKSQGFGSASSRGTSIEYFEHVAGKKASNSLMDDINSSWSRITNSSEIQTLLNSIIEKFNPRHPENSVNNLFRLRSEVQKINNNYWKELKTAEINDLIAMCSGLWLEAISPTANLSIGQSLDIQLEVVARNPNLTVVLESVDGKKTNQILHQNKVWKESIRQTANKTNQPYWLTKPHTLGKFTVDIQNTGKPWNTDNPQVICDFTINGEKLSVIRNVHYRYVDPVQGEIYQPISVQPELTVEIDQPSILLQSNTSKDVSITIHKHNINLKNGLIQVHVPKGWKANPATIQVPSNADQFYKQNITITALEKSTNPDSIYFTWNDQKLQSSVNINYDHIPHVSWYPSAVIKLQQIELINPVKRIGYVSGAGDLVPQALQSIGTQVDNLMFEQIQSKNLSSYDAIVIGVRFFNVESNAESILNNLLEYVESGGVVLTQYNVNSKLLAKKFGPYPFTISRDRVTEEDAKVDFDKNDPIFNYPNKITSADFDGWIQERGLYFADQIDRKYRTPIRIHDKDEQPHNGSLLVTPYGKGKFVYTSLAFFRQLPAGVPGAYRLFVNLLAKE